MEDLEQLVAVGRSSIAELTVGAVAARVDATAFDGEDVVSARRRLAAAQYLKE
ncbi:hypothetical protein [Streptomyces sp. NPDC006551]|uniref:hypothetical protein n=1 Tax=Streptomyces sp. NPDC006551 TaxID=3157178 RepID=UPI0033B5C16E